MTKRELEELEKAINAIKKHGLEVPLAKELGEASKLLTRLKRLERIRHEILELKQATVAEIRSYQNPPAVVHKVMTATFLLLGHQEKETKVLYSVGSHIHNNYEQFTFCKLQMYLLKVGCLFIWINVSNIRSGNLYKPWSEKQEKKAWSVAALNASQKKFL